MFVLLPGQAAQDPVPPAAPQPAEKAAPSAEKSDTIIRAETKLVLVDAIVTDKRGGYVRDLTAKDFKVWEDKKEQKITSFSFEADPNFKDNRTRYMVLLLTDDANLPDVITQSQARKAAVQFVEHNANPQSLIAVADFNGVFKMTQNFTASTDKLIKACRDLKLTVMGAGDPGTLQHCVSRVFSALLTPGDLRSGEGALGGSWPEERGLADRWLSRAVRDVV